MTANRHQKRAVDVAAFAKQQRITRGIEAASHAIRFGRAGDVDAVHRLTEDMSQDGLRQMVATLALMFPDGDIRTLVALAERRIA